MTGCQPHTVQRLHQLGQIEIRPRALGFSGDAAVRQNPTATDATLAHQKLRQLRQCIHLRCRRSAAAEVADQTNPNSMHYRPQQLSVGQQQRVAVARALANHPRLVLADEPTGNLDTRRAGEALTIIRELCTKNGAALLLVSHSTDVLNQFDDVVDFHELNRAFDGDAQDAQSPTGAASL